MPSSSVAFDDEQASEREGSVPRPPCLGFGVDVWTLFIVEFAIRASGSCAGGGAGEADYADDFEPLDASVLYPATQAAAAAR